MASARLRFELLFCLGWIIFGALLLPAMVYGVGVLMLGTYGDGGLGAFYGNLYRDLLSGSAAPAVLIFGPYAAVMAARLPWLGRRHADPVAAEDEAPSVTPPSPRTSRVEPRIEN